MGNQTPNENEAMLVLFKDFSTDYNANTLSKKIGITPRGTLKLLKNLYVQHLLTRKTMGKATFYKLNLEDYYTFRTIETLLIREAREKAARWLSEFTGLYKETDIVIIFGSVIRDPGKANDIDLLLVLGQNNLSKAKKIIREKNKILVKPIHPILQSPSDIEKNLHGKDEVLLSALREGYILHGYDKLIEVVKDVAGV